MTRRLVRSRLLTAAAALAASSLCSSAAAAERLLLYNHRVFIGASINGVRTEALLDSAAEATLVDPTFAKVAHLPKGETIAIKGSGGTAPAEIVEGVTLEVLGLTLHPEAIAVTDLADISRRLVKRPVQLVIGRELFDAARLNIDLRNRTIAVVVDGAPETGTELPLTAHAGNESIPAIVNGTPAQAEFDLGNGSDALISIAFAKKLGLKPTGSSTGGGIGGAIHRDIVELDTLVVAGKTYRHIRAAVDAQPSANDLNIGTRILGDFRITTDFPHHRIWLQSR